MNILVVFTYGYSINTWDESGTFYKEIESYKLISKNDVRFTFLTFAKNEPYIDYLKNYNIEVIPVYKKIKFSKYKTINYLKSFLIPFKFRSDLKNIDIVKQNQLLGSWISIILKYVLNKPLFIRTGYDMYEFSIKAKKKFLTKFLYKWLTFFSLYFADMYSVSSKCDKNFLQKNFNKQSQNLVVRPNWVKEVMVTDLDRRHDNRLLCIGRLEEQKNHQLIISAFSNTSYQIDFIGEGSLESELKKQAKIYNTNINFLGKANNEEIMDSLLKYKYYITSSKYEGNPKSTLEALSSGCIVIASDIPNHREIIKHGFNGFLYSENKDSLLNTFENVTKNIDLKTISSNARNIFQSNSLELIVKREHNDLKSLKV